MGDSENGQLPCKKRSRENNPGLDDNEVINNDSSPIENGTFKTASQEVLATRRIITSEAIISNGQVDDESKTTTKVEDASVEETDKAKDDNNKEETEKNGDSGGGAFSSFQQHSSDKNAFTGLASTGFSTSSFSFGLVQPDGSTGSLTEQSSFNFGMPTNGNSSLFGTSTKSAGTTATTTTAFPSKQEVSVETGEENEKPVFTADSVMFEYLQGGWKERGKGEVKINVSSTNENGKARLVMRSKGNYRLILNASLYPEMKLASMDKKGITFACVNSVSEEKDALSTFALKFKDPTVVEEFRAVVEEHKESR